MYSATPQSMNYYPATAHQPVGGSRQDSTNQQSRQYQTGNDYLPGDTYPPRNAHQPNTNRMSLDRYYPEYNTSSSDPYRANASYPGDAGYSLDPAYRPAAYESSVPYDRNTATYQSNTAVHVPSTFSYNHQQREDGQQQRPRPNGHSLPNGRSRRTSDQDSSAGNGRHPRTESTARYLNRWDEHWEYMEGNRSNGQGMPTLLRLS